MTARERIALTTREVDLLIERIERHESFARIAQPEASRPLPARLSPRATLPSRHIVIHRLVTVALTVVLVVGYLAASQADYLAAGGVR